MKIYTKKGDKGKTTLFDGTSLLKSDLRIESYGTVDELNSTIGLLAAYPVNEGRLDLLTSIQSLLFNLAAVLAAGNSKHINVEELVTEKDIQLLEESIDEIQSRLPELKQFILPAGSVEVAQAHVARCVCRRTERLVVRLSEKEKVPEIVITYLNRLSDYLFALARQVSKDLGMNEVYWTSNR